jgi:hypothetical protein
MPATMSVLALAAFLAFPFHGRPIAFRPGAISGRVALRADEDLSLPANGCPGVIAFRT